jgi:hypothetical protein
VVVAVRNRPLKIKTIDRIGEFVRGHPPMSAGIAVKLLSNHRDQLPIRAVIAGSPELR